MLSLLSPIGWKPFYCTWFWSSSWIDFSSLSFWLINFPIILFFVLLAVYLYGNINLRNIDKRWVRKLMIAGPEYKILVEAKKFVAEIDEFKKDLVLNKELQNIQGAGLFDLIRVRSLPAGRPFSPMRQVISQIQKSASGIGSGSWTVCPFQYWLFTTGMERKRGKGNDCR